MGDNLKLNYILASLILVLFVSISGLLIVNKSETRTVYYNTQEIVNLGSSQDIQPVQNEVGIIVQADENNIDQITEELRLKGAKVNKFKVGKVITASIPADQVSNLNVDVLPNREVQAFSIDTSETNVESFWNNGFTGKNVKVAVLDTGVNSNNVIAANDFTGSNTIDENGHGTKIAEIILAMAPDVQLINAKVLDKDGKGSEASVIAGINYAVEQGANVISLSLGGYFDDINSPLVAAVEDAVNKGVTVVVAAGNCGIPGQCGNFVGVATPGNSPNAITVGSVSGEQAVPYSPGQDFTSYIKPDVVAPESANSLTGTSASTPFVSGAAALIIEKYNSDPLEVKSLIEQNAVDLGIEGKDTVFGSGKLNLNFLTETPTENKVEIITNPVQTNRAIYSFSTAKSYAGDWSTFDSGLHSYLTGNYNGEERSDFYNRTFGFIFKLNRIYKFNSTKITKEYVGEENCGFYYKITDIDIINPNTAYFASMDRIKRFNGTTWIKENLPGHKNTTINGCPLKGFNLTAIAFNTTGFAGGTNFTGQGVMLNKTLAGAKWTLTSGTFYPIKDIKFVNANLAFALGSKKVSNTVKQLIYKWNGVSWSIDQNITLPGELNEIEVINNNLAFAVGYNGTIMRWNGVSWNITSSPTTKALFDVSFYNSTYGYAVGDNVTILKYNNGWTKQSEGAAFISLYSCTPQNGQCVPSTIYNTTFYDVHVLNPNVGFLFGKGISNSLLEFVELRLKPSAPKIDVPKSDLEQGTTLTINLKDYSDGDSFSLNSGNCLLNGGNLTVNPSPSFIGLMICVVTATKTGLTSSQAISIEVHPLGPVSDLEINAFDIKVVDVNAQKINVTVNNIGRSTASNVGIRLLDLRNNKVINNLVQTITSIQNNSKSTVSFTMSISRGDKLVAVADYNNTIVEYSESNNRAENVFNRLDAYLNISTQFDSAIRSYLVNSLSNYNIVNSQSADVIISVGYNLGDKAIGCSLGNVYYNGRVVNDAHAGLIFAKQNNVNICGARIEGLVNALKRLNKEDVLKNKDTFFDRSDLGAISIRDYFNGKTLNTELVNQALNGPLQSSEDFVETTDGRLLRLKRYKPFLSQNFIDYLFFVDNSKPWLEPVVMAGGLWSDVNAWNQAGREISSGIEDSYLSKSVKYAPRDVWLVELTGGPNTECDTCYDYTYDDVVDKHFSALVGGVLRLTGKSQVAYVGHSNGGRVALDALRNLTLNGAKPFAGKLSNGSSFGLNANPIRSYIGVGVPGAFSSSTLFVDSVKNGNGDRVVNELNSENIKHVKLSEVAARLKTTLGSVIGTFTQRDTEEISSNILKRYFYFANSTTDNLPGFGGIGGLSRAMIIQGDQDFDPNKDSDMIVPVSDANAIYGMISASNKSKIIVHTTHSGQTEDKSVKTKIKERLNE